MRANLLALLGWFAICSGCEAQGANDAAGSPISKGSAETVCPSQPPSVGTRCATRDMTCWYQNTACLPGQGTNTYSCRDGSWASDDVCAIIERFCDPNELTVEPCTGQAGCKGRWLCDQSGKMYSTCECGFEPPDDAGSPDAPDDETPDSPIDASQDTGDATADGHDPE